MKKIVAVVLLVLFAVAAPAWCKSNLEVKAEIISLKDFVNKNDTPLSLQRCNAP